LDVYCSNCGSVISGDARFCAKCGGAQQLRAPVYAPPAGVPAPVATAPQPQYAPLLAVAGFFAGAFVGFLARPSIPLLGQLPFSIVITRGANLGGLDLLLRPMAEDSFNRMLLAGVVGAVAGCIIGLLLMLQPRRG
jgi:hypothetical protein